MTRFYKESSKTSQILLPEIRNSEIRLRIQVKGCRDCSNSLQTTWYNFEMRWDARWGHVEDEYGYEYMAAYGGRRW